MKDTGPQPAMFDALLELPVATGVHHDDQVEVGVGDLVEMSLQHACAVLGSQDRVGAGRATAGASVRQLDVLADGCDQLARLAPDAEPVAQVAGVLEPDPRAVVGWLARYHAVAR